MRGKKRIPYSVFDFKNRYSRPEDISGGYRSLRRGILGPSDVGKSRKFEFWETAGIKRIPLLSREEEEEEEIAIYHSHKDIVMLFQLFYVWLQCYQLLGSTIVDHPSRYRHPQLVSSSPLRNSNECLGARLQ